MGATDVIAFFQKTFGSKPAHLVQAPGRLELLGNHTDYNQGLVLALAVDKHIYMTASGRVDGKVSWPPPRLASANASTSIFSQKIRRRPGLIT